MTEHQHPCIITINQKGHAGIGFTIIMPDGLKLTANPSTARSAKQAQEKANEIATALFAPFPLYPPALSAGGNPNEAEGGGAL